MIDRDYLVEGDLFLMSGAWELTVRVESARGVELITMDIVVGG
jgi:hypothetical protein